ncbi:serine/threonine-protein kinase PLK1 [Hydra vulgaris]|uniref:Serine/threonine-protein kinase PLK n=1 Tax=Hydra vulgaris TaxID=6087 RepID=T2MFR1_HYDVU|nr:serine/threonine-protein kinase PLK1 [Hydra vulgaris]
MNKISNTEKYRQKMAEKPKITTLPVDKITPAPELAEEIVNPDTGVVYIRGKFLGKGGFAKCYEMTDKVTNSVFAGKIVPKSLLTKSHQRDKMAQEIQIHRELSYKHIVGFHSYFEDAHYVYIILELCNKRSMMELYKRRKAVTEPEVRFYMKQIVDAVCFLHSKHIIHRDLKLGNLFLNDDFQVKIGDFGLATRVEFDGERKKTLCGTPNYIAPEVLCKKGHSYEVDVWSVGCILYTLLVGKPPFETMSLKETYHRIKKNEYYIPAKVPHSAQMLIIKMLRPEPETRPTMKECQEDRFFTDGFTPISLPNSSLTMAPRFASAQYYSDRRPLSDANRDLGKAVLSNIPESSTTVDKNNVSRAVFVKDGLGHEIDEDPAEETDGEPDDHYLGHLQKLLDRVLESRPADRDSINMDEAEDPALTPVSWVSKWVDYSDKYGLGYQLSDGSVGVLFNDATRLLMHEDEKSLQYIDKLNKETFFTIDNAPPNMQKKKTLLEYFHDYMNEHLLKTGSGVATKGMESARLPYLRSWFRTRSGIILHLNIGILQINFFQDHTKVIICPKMDAFSYIDENRNFRTYKLSGIEKHGCTREIFVRLRYAKTMVERLSKKLAEEKKEKLSAI